MFWIKHLPLAVLLILCISISAALAQETDCTGIVEDALSVAEDACLGVGRNQICYGNLSLESVTTAEDVTFADVGDTINLTDLESLSLSPMDEEAGTWGLALMKTQPTNIANTLPGQAVTFLLFGAVEVTPEEESTEVFYFSSNLGEASCEQAPDGLLIRTPEGDVTVTLTVNNVEITLGSTAYLTAAPDDVMTVALLDGEAEVTADGETVTVEAGNLTTIPLDENLSPGGTPTEPEAFDPDFGQFLPLTLLDAVSAVELSESPEATEAASGEAINPISGTWRISFGDLTIGTPCSYDAEPYIRNFFTTLERPIDFPVPFTPQGYLQALNPDLPYEDLVVESVEGNNYVFSFALGDSRNTYDLRVESEALIEGIQNAGAQDCPFTIEFTLERLGD